MVFINICNKTNTINHILDFLAVASYKNKIDHKEYETKLCNKK